MSEKDIKAVDDLSVADGTIDDLSVADVMANVEKRVADGNVDDKRLADMMAEFDRHSNVGVPGVTEMPRRRNVTQTTRISTLTSYVLNNVPEEVLNFDIVDFYRTIILNLKYDQKKKSEIVEFLRNLFFIEGTKGGNIRIYIKDPNLILEAYERISDNANVDLWEGLFKDNKDTIFSYFIEKKVFGVFKAGPSISGPLSEVARFSELDADLIVESPYIDGLDAYTRYSFVIMALEEDEDQIFFSMNKFLSK